jgi:hypothetical protein
LSYINIPSAQNYRSLSPRLSLENYFVTPSDDELIEYIDLILEQIHKSTNTIYRYEVLQFASIHVIILLSCSVIMGVDMCHSLSLTAKQQNTWISQFHCIYKQGNLLSINCEIILSVYIGVKYEEFLGHISLMAHEIYLCHDDGY